MGKNFHRRCSLEVPDIKHPWVNIYQKSNGGYWISNIQCQSKEKAKSMIHLNFPGYNYICTIQLKPEGVKTTTTNKPERLKFKSVEDKNGFI